jgi:hypothetical protein
MIEDKTNGYLDDVKASKQAQQIEGRHSLSQALAYLDGYAERNDRGKTRCLLFKDFAPLSFTFTMERRNQDGAYEYWFNGGLIYHGPHDKGGGGSFPTLSVALEPTHGWLVHT